MSKATSRNPSPGRWSTGETTIMDGTDNVVDEENTPTYPDGDHVARRESRMRKRDPFLVTFDHNDTEDPREFPAWRKWQIIIIAFTLEVWANVISAAVVPGIEALAADLDVSVPKARVVQAIFLYGFAIGAVTLTPISEDYGRWPTHVVSVFLVGIFQIPCALAPNFATVVVFRFLAGFFAATTFNAVGIVSDMWDPESQGMAVNSFAFAAEFGIVIGPIIGGYTYVSVGYRWIFGVLGLGTAFFLLLWILTCPETRAGIILTRRAKRKRKETGDSRWHSHHELAMRERSFRTVVQETVFRPVYMLFREPIVLWFALFDGFNYAIIYLFLEAIPLIYKQYNWSEGALNLPFLALLVGVLIAYFLYPVQMAAERREARKNNGEMPPEARLLWMLPGAVLFPASLFWFAWTSRPPIPWIVSCLATAMFGISSHIIFISVSDYTIASYSIYSASAVGAQSLLREILSGSVTFVSEPMYHNLGYQWASSTLAFIALVLAMLPPLLYFFGPQIRAKSAFALEIAQAEARARVDKQDARDAYEAEQESKLNEARQGQGHAPAELQDQDTPAN